MKTIGATYENGVLKPAEPLHLAEGSRVELTVTPVADDNQTETPGEIMARISRLSNKKPEDGLGGRDHDEVLYGSGKYGAWSSLIRAHGLREAWTGIAITKPRNSSFITIVSR